MSYTDYDDEFLSSESNEEMNEKINRIKKAMRRGSLSQEDMPGEEGAEAIVNYCIEKGQFNDALDFAKIWLDYASYSSDAWQKYGFILLNLNRLSEAETALKKALSMNPQEPEIFMTLALVYENWSDYNIALEYIEKALLLDSSNEEILFQKGILLQLLHRFDDSIAIFRYLTHIEHFKKDAWLEIAHCYNMKYDYITSENCYLTALEIDPFDHNIWYNLGVIQNQLGKYYTSVESYDYATTIDNNFFVAWYNRANTLCNIGKLNEAIECYNEALRCKPSDVDTMYNLAGTYGDVGNFEAAIVLFTKVLALEPFHYQSYFGRGICYDALNNFKKALLDFDRALKLKDNSSEIYHAKADTLYNSGKINESIDAYQRAILLDPENYDCMFDLGSTLYELDRFQEAKSIFLEILAYCPTYSDSYYSLAKTELKLGRKNEALHFLKLAFKIDPKKIAEAIEEKKIFSSIWTKVLKEIDSINLI